jgi:hypothetical protein
MKLVTSIVAAMALATFILAERRSLTKTAMNYSLVIIQRRRDPDAFSTVPLSTVLLRKDRKPKKM